MFIRDNRGEGHYFLVSSSDLNTRPRCEGDHMACTIATGRQCSTKIRPDATMRQVLLDNKDKNENSDKVESYGRTSERIQRIRSR